MKVVLFAAAAAVEVEVGGCDACDLNVVVVLFVCHACHRDDDVIEGEVGRSRTCSEGNRIAHQDPTPSIIELLVQ